MSMLPDQEKGTFSQASYLDNEDIEYNAADALISNSTADSSTSSSAFYPPSNRGSGSYKARLSSKGKVRLFLFALGSSSIFLFAYKAWYSSNLDVLCGTLDDLYPCKDNLQSYLPANELQSVQPSTDSADKATNLNEIEVPATWTPAHPIKSADKATESNDVIVPPSTWTPVHSKDPIPVIAEEKELPPIASMDKYVQLPKKLRPSWPDPWEDLGAGWQGRKYLDIDRFQQDESGGWKGMEDPVTTKDPPADLLLPAYEYAASQTPSATQGSLDPNTGRPRPIKHENLYWGLKDEWTPPTLRVSQIGLPNGPKTKGNEKVQYQGKITSNSDIDSEERHRRDWVKRAFMHSWEGYKRQAWGHDELKPVSGTFKNPFNGWGATLIDSLDTLLIMNLSHEYNLAREHVAKVDFTYLMSSEENPIDMPSMEPQMTPIEAKLASYSARSPIGVPTFETVIRYLGGLIAAYDLSQDGLMLQRATELGDWILPCLGTRHGLAQSRCQIGANALGFASGRVNLAEVGSLTLEFTRLSMLTGNEVYYHAVQRSTDTLNTAFTPAVNITSENRTIPRGRLGTLLPHYIDPRNPGALSGDYSFGGSSDSYYEYLIKQEQLLKGATNQYSHMYKDAIQSAYQFLISKVEVIPGRNDLTTIGSVRAGVWVSEIEHLTCFAGAMLGLGSRLLGRAGDLETAKNLTNTCVWAYESTSTGIGPEKVQFYRKDDPSRFVVVDKPDGSGQIRVPRQTPLAGIRSTDAKYISRPETIESVFYMYRLTGDREWQNHGWRMFTSWVEWAVTEYGFADITNVYSGRPLQQDSMQSFALAETLKYYYLLFAPVNEISLDEWVFNTEAHPFRIPQDQPSPIVSLWSGPEPSQVPLDNFQSSIGEGTSLQKWARVRQSMILRQAEAVEAEQTLPVPKIDKPLYIRPSDIELKEAAKFKAAIDQHQKDTAAKAKAAAAKLKAEGADLGLASPIRRSQ